MLRVIKIDLAFKHALLASLQHEHRAWLVEHRNVVKLRLGPENADTIKPCRIVPLAVWEEQVKNRIAIVA